MLAGENEVDEDEGAVFAGVFVPFTDLAMYGEPYQCLDGSPWDWEDPGAESPWFAGGWNSRQLGYWLVAQGDRLTVTPAVQEYSRWSDHAGGGGFFREGVLAVRDDQLGSIRDRFWAFFEGFVIAAG